MTAQSPPSDAPETIAEPTWSLGVAFAFILLWAALMSVVTFGSIIVAASISVPAGGDLTQEQMQAYLQTFVHDVTSNPYSAFGSAGCVLLTWLMTFGILEMFFRVPRPVLGRALGLRAPEPRWSISSAIPIGIVICIVGTVLGSLLETEETGPFDEILRTVPGFAGTALIALVIAPLAEETFFRGFLFPPMARAFSTPTAVFVNGAVFAAAHIMTAGGDPGYLVPVLLLGVVLASLRAWSGSVVPGMVAHLCFNATSLLLFVLFHDAAPT